MSTLSNSGSASRPNFPTVSVGDTVRIGVLLVEGNKERTQYFEGTVIAIKSREWRKSLRVRKLSQGIGIEGRGSQNLIIRNISYENDTGYGVQITNVFDSGLANNPNLLDNIEVPPYW